MFRTLLFVAVLNLHAETGYQAWLRYEPSPTPLNLPAVVTVAGDSPVLRTAQQELIRGLRGMTGRIAAGGNRRIRESPRSCFRPARRASRRTHLR